MKRITIKQIIKKKGKRPIVCLSAYSKNFAEIIDKHCDIILVGDSLGMVLYGMRTTKEVKLETMILHAKAVKSHTRKSLVVFDMPFKSVTNKFMTYKNAKQVLKKTKCDAIKIEGGTKTSKLIKYLTAKGIPVMGHIGMLPQYSSKYKLKGKSLPEKKRILKDAIAVAKSGAFAIVIECVVEKLAKEITQKIKIPTIGIGASKHCDGQILVTDDMIGLSNFYPKFVKKYSNIRKMVEKSVKNYCRDVKLRRFPSSRYVYN